MLNRLTLARHIDHSTASQKLRRLGATACEPAWIGLWAAGLGLPHGSPGAWLLCAKDIQRALLMVGSELPALIDKPDTGIQLDSGLPPTTEALNRLWLWERMATPRHWRMQVLNTPAKPLWLPCWLGYIQGRKQQRLIIISGLSGEPLPMLKPIVLKGLQQAHQEKQTIGLREQQRSSF